MRFDHGVALLVGDVREQLKHVADESVHCVVTSPPYFSLRDYGGQEQQIGLEETPDQFIDQLVSVFREVRRVLRSDGVCWVNMGDSYAAKPASGNTDFKDGRKNRGQSKSGGIPTGFKPKDRMGIPHMLVFALRANGWYWRDEIIWHKPAPMPESVRDRTTKAHEYIFLLTKSPKYFYDCEAIKEPVSGNAHSRGKGTTPKSNANEAGVKNNDSFASATNGLVSHRNKRSVWTVNTEPYSGAHFAVFPPKLIEPCVLAGTSEHGCCSECGAPYERIVESHRIATRPGTNSKVNQSADGGQPGMVVGNRDPQRHCSVTHTTGWQATCECDAAIKPCTVLDPFNGSGTTGVVARNNGCRYIGVELNPEYVELTHKRLRQPSLFVH